GIERRVDGVAGEADQQRVAVGQGLRDCLGGEVAAGAGPVLDQHGLAERRGEQLRDRPRHRVGGAARGCADQQLDRLGGILRGAAWWASEEHRRQKANDSRDFASAHRGPPQLAANSRITSSIVAIRATGRTPSIAARWTSSVNAAQPSATTVQSNSRTWASRTVEATPPLVTMPVKYSSSTPHLRSTHSRRDM